MNIKIDPMTVDDIEWVRQERNRPEAYRYFRQDKPISEDEQKKWWRTLDHNKIRLFVMRKVSGDRVGYVGFNPLNQYAMTAEFGIFIVPGEQKNGYARQALLWLLKHGFYDLNLRTIYSDCLEYPGENRFDFYEKFGFVKHPIQDVRYKKQGVWVASTKFFMTKERYDELYDEDKGSLAVLAASIPKANKWQREGKKGGRVYSGANNVKPAP